ncbi:MAG: hypothetical protein AUK16_00150 [Parcubacteria group bacterium CG2_30_44_11]|nr:MAG: hypothetical protein AUK16_00150 [Parcubacteria group bacterium CG2_30_44_11]
MDWTQLMFWSAALATALFVLIRGADIFITGARNCGASLGMSPFAIGVFIVGFGTSLPELASSVAGALSGSTEIVIANVVGSNITNILLIVGVMALLAGRVVIKQELLMTELPLFVIAQMFLVIVIIDGVVEQTEAGFLIILFTAYVWYVLSGTKNNSMIGDERPNFRWRDVLWVVLGLAAVLVGAAYTVEMAVNIATAVAVPIGLVSITAIAIGTSLPELFVTLQAVRSRHTEMAMGNIFGSNTFNALIVTGIPGLLVPLAVDTVVLELGLWFMIAASIMIFVIGLSRQVMRSEGFMMLIFFVFFMYKLAAFI